MEIRQVEDGGILIIELEGQLDAHSSIHLDKVIQEAMQKGTSNIIVCFTALSYISSAGLGVFVSHLDSLKGMKGQFVFYDMPGHIYSVFEILGLHKVVAIVQDIEEAKRLLRDDGNEG